MLKQKHVEKEAFMNRKILTVDEMRRLTQLKLDVTVDSVL